MQGYAKANSTVEAMDTLKWGTDYLLRTLAKTSKVGQKYPEYNIAYQVCSWPALSPDCICEAASCFHAMSY
jgi:hypothetical protein